MCTSVHKWRSRVYERWSSKEEEHVVVLLCTNKKQASDKQLQTANK